MGNSKKLPTREASIAHTVKRAMLPYDQRAWELAAESHSRYKRLVEIAVSPEFHAACVRRVKELEEKYPQLKTQL